MNEIKKLKVKYKKTIQKEKQQIKLYQNRIKSAKTQKQKNLWRARLEVYNKKSYLNRKNEFGIYEKIAQVRKNTKGWGNLTDLEKKEFRKYQTKIIGVFRRKYEEFYKSNKKLDLDRVSVNLLSGFSKEGVKQGEKFSLTGLLNATQYAIPTSSQEFQVFKQGVDEVLDRLKRVKPKNTKGFWSNADFDLGEVAMQGRMTAEEALDYNNLQKSLLFGEDGKSFDTELDGSKFEGDDIGLDTPRVMNVSYKNGFRIVYNPSDPSLVENIEVVDTGITLDDYNKLISKLISKGTRFRVDLNKLEKSIRRRIGNRRKRLN